MFIFIFDKYLYDDRSSDFRLEKMQSIRNQLLTMKCNCVSGYSVTEWNIIKIKKDDFPYIYIFIYIWESYFSTFNMK